MKKYKVSHPTGVVKGEIAIGGSKSLSNRVLILNALSDSPSEISNLSDSDDTVTLNKLLSIGGSELDAHHAGTTFRFMTAYLTLQEGTHVLTGSDRMKQRPIGALVDALRTIGADITYLENEGYPPLKIRGGFEQISDSVDISAGISSQFLSALCMIAPKLANGLTLNLIGDLVSEPYLLMTLRLMEQFGVTADYDGQSVKIAPQSYTSSDYTVESDWSSASYHFTMAALAKDADIKLTYFVSPSLQADSAMLEFCHNLGVTVERADNYIRLTKSENCVKVFDHDFLTHPDIAQTIAGLAAGKNIPVNYTGLKTLFIKETDRVAALTTELAKVGVQIVKDNSGVYEYCQSGSVDINLPEFDTYQDHRMAMALAPLALISQVVINEPLVVNKSYPRYWDDLRKLGFLVEEIN